MNTSKGAITGASSGFGKGAALAFAQEGASLVLAARRGEVRLNRPQRDHDSGHRLRDSGFAPE